MIQTQSLLPSVLRTLVPIVVGYFAALPLLRVLGLSDEQLTALATALITAGYWLLVRAAEKYLAPQFGWLLGYASQPVYAPPAVVAGTGDLGQVGADLILLVGCFIGIVLLLFGVSFN